MREPDFGHGKICYVIMPSSDPARAARFYESVFGWTIRSHDDGTLAFDDGVGQVSGMWVTGKPPASDDGLEIHLMVDDLDTALRAVEAGGGSVDVSASEISPEERYALFRDPDGNRLGLYEHRPERGIQ